MSVPVSLVRKPRTGGAGTRAPVCRRLVFPWPVVPHLSHGVSMSEELTIAAWGPGWPLLKDRAGSSSAPLLWPSPLPETAHLLRPFPLPALQDSPHELHLGAHALASCWHLTLALWPWPLPTSGGGLQAQPRGQIEQDNVTFNAPPPSSLLPSPLFCLVSMTTLSPSCPLTLYAEVPLT